MGLLDDAIREHLELKRRRGADPGEVAREQQEALDVADEEREAGDAELSPEPADVDGAWVDAEGAAPEQELSDGDAPEAREPQASAPEGAREGEPSTVSQETAELDMQSVLDEGHDPAELSSPVVPELTDSPGRAFHSEALDDERRLQDEDELADVARPLPGQERLSFE
jgi:hypothetical protein